jgi:phospholipid transport system transporter-binding protein
VSNATIHGEGGHFQVSGELSFDTVNALLAESQSTIFAQSTPLFELDLGAVRRADSAGLALLIQWMRMAHAKNCEIRFHNLPQQLLAIARAGELEPLLPVAE